MKNNKKFNLKNKKKFNLKNLISKQNLLKF